MNNGVYALPGFMTPAAKNWKSQLLTNEDGSVKLCVYVGKPGTKVYYSLGIPGWKWGFIKDAQYFIDKGYPQDVIDEVSKFADYLEEEVTALPEGTVIPDIIINGWPVPITESPIEGKVYWILNIPKFVLPAGDTEVQISANGKLIKYTITRPYFSIHYNTPEYTASTGTPGGSGETEADYLLFNGDMEIVEGRLDALVDGENFLSWKKVKGWAIELPSLKTATSMFFGVKGLGDFSTSFPELTTASNTFRETKGVGVFSSYMPKLKTSSDLFYFSDIEIYQADTPLMTVARGLLRSCPRLHTVNGNLSMVEDGYQLCTGSPLLTTFNSTLPKLRDATSGFYSAILNKESVLRICNSIPTWSSGTHNITLGIHVDHQGDADIAAAVADIESRGWTVTLQWNGTASIAAASTYRWGDRRDPVYAKQGEDSDGKLYLDWGHYVTDWESNGYIEFASIEEAKEHFNIVDDINLINAE